MYYYYLELYKAHIPMYALCLLQSARIVEAQYCVHEQRTQSWSRVARCGWLTAIGIHGHDNSRLSLQYYRWGFNTSLNVSVLIVAEMSKCTIARAQQTLPFMSSKLITTEAPSILFPIHICTVFTSSCMSFEGDRQLHTAWVTNSICDTHGSFQIITAYCNTETSFPVILMYL